MKNLFYNLIHFLTLTSVILVNSCSKGEFELKGQITNSVNDSWIEYVKDEKLSGIHLFADNAWNSEFIKSYNINSIPRYLLIDNKGFIISADASRPSDKSLINQINSLKHINCNEENCVI